MRILIIGAGAIGNVIAVRLARHDDIFIASKAKKNVVNALNEKGITLLENKGVYHSFIPVISDKKNIYPIDIVIIACKSYDLLSVIKLNQDILSQSTAIILVQTCLRLNELPWGELKTKVWASSIMFGAIGIGSGITIESDPGYLRIGPLFNQSISIDESKMIKSTMSKVAPTYVIKNISAALFAKVCTNAVMFPFSIAGGSKFSSVFSSKESLNIASLCLMECAKIATANKIKSRNFFGSYSTSDLLNYKKARGLIESIVRKYPNVIPSTLIDIVRKRQNELQFFHDDLLEIANSINVEVPHLEFLVKATKDLIETTDSFNSKTLNNFLLKIKSQLNS